MDIHVETEPLEFNDLRNTAPGESSEVIRARVSAARRRQEERYADIGVSCNARLSGGKTKELCAISDSAAELLRRSFDKMHLSARAYDRVLKVARTCADLDSSEIIQKKHIARAISYRSLDRKYWG